MYMCSILLCKNLFLLICQCCLVILKLTLDPSPFSTFCCVRSSKSSYPDFIRFFYISCELLKNVIQKSTYMYMYMYMCTVHNSLV